MTRLLTPDEFRRVFDAYAFSVFRLETLQEYREPNEAASLEAFRSGQRQPADPSKSEWLAAVRAARYTGRVVQRVHVAREPLSEYLRFELSWSYAPSVAAGEDIRIVPIPQGEPWPEQLPQQDFWLFDASTLYVQQYDDQGTWQGAEHDPDPSHVVAACRWREAALHLGTPWTDYVARQPQLSDALRRSS